MPEMAPVNSASPWELSGTGAVSSAASDASPALHTSVPSTCVMGPAVPLKAVPLITRPSTSNAVAPFERFTRAWPRSADHANVPLSMSATGLSTPCAVITPTTLLQRTAGWAIAVEARAKVTNPASPANPLLISDLHSSKGADLDDRPRMGRNLGGRFDPDVTARCLFSPIRVTHAMEFGPFRLNTVSQPVAGGTSASP